MHTHHPIMAKTFEKTTVIEATGATWHIRYLVYACRCMWCVRGVCAPCVRGVCMVGAWGACMVLITSSSDGRHQRKRCEREDHSVDGDAVEDDDAHTQPEEPPPEQGQLARG